MCYEQVIEVPRGLFCYFLFLSSFPPSSSQSPLELELSGGLTLYRCSGHKILPLIKHARVF